MTSSEWVFLLANSTVVHTSRVSSDSYVSVNAYFLWKWEAYTFLLCLINEHIGYLLACLRRAFILSDLPMVRTPNFPSSKWAFAPYCGLSNMSTYKCPHHGFKYIVIFARSQILGIFLMPSKLTSWHTSSLALSLNFLTNAPCNPWATFGKNVPNYRSNSLHPIWNNALQSKLIYANMPPN